MRRNVLEWLAGRVPKARHALVLTHNIDFLFLQSVLAPRLRRAGDPRLVVFADAACAAQAFAVQSSLVDGLGDRYRVVPVDLGGARRFHPKALFLSGPDGAALAVGSGNLTHGGMGANHEAWAFAASDGEDASMVAAFRDYVSALMPRLPLPEPLRDWWATIFDGGQAWAADLPPAAGLAGSPAARPLLDQIAAAVEGPVRAVDVIAPYHDERGAALAAVAARFGAPVTCWMQPGRAGLSRAAADVLPADVSLRSIECEQARRPSFIHAKILALHGDGRTVLAVGSANCSQAALLADASWGNAELMALGTVGAEAVEGLLSGLERGDAPPPLPELPPSEAWALPAEAPLRILAARFEAGRLRVAYRAPVGTTRLSAASDGWAQPATDVDAAACVAEFGVPLRPKTIAIQAVGPDGSKLSSAEAWVDDEASLSAPATLRRVIQRLRDDGEAGWLSAQAFREVLELFREYICDAEAARRRVGPAGRVDQPAAAYDPSAVFSGSFGAATGSPADRGGDGTIGGLLAIVERLFAVGRAVGEHFEGGRAEGDVGDAQDGEEPDVEVEQRRLMSLGRASPEPRVRAQLRRALSAVEQALRAPEFVASRTPALLGADLSLAAILLVKGLSAGLLDTVDYRRITRELWAALFFGGGGSPGLLTARIETAAEPADRNAFLAAFCSPRLSAALALWCATEWAADDADASWFRLSAALVHQRHPCLFGAAAAETVSAEIDAFATKLLPQNERLIAVRAWTGVIRAGEALRCLSVAIRTLSAADLRAAAASNVVDPSTLVWVNGHLAFPATQAFRRAKSKVHVRFLGEVQLKPYFVEFIVPVRDVLEAGILAMPALAIREVEALIAAAV